MANWYASSAKWTAVTAWAATTAYVVGDLRRQLAAPTVGNERVFRCTTAGTSGGSEPAWTLTNNGTTNDGTAVWTAVTGQETYNWTAPFARIVPVMGSGFMGSGDTLFVGSDHAETQATALTTPSNASGYAGPLKIICVDVAGTIPPVTADLRTTATVTTTGAVAINIGTANGLLAYFYGITFASSAALNLASAGNFTDLVFEACQMYLTGNFIFIGSSTAAIQTSVKFTNTSVKFDNAGSGFVFRGGWFTWLNTVSAVQGAAVPSNLLNISAVTSTFSSKVTFDGLDLSSVSTNLVLWPTANLLADQDVFITNCRLHASVTVATALASRNRRNREVYLLNCDSGSANTRNEKHNYDGDLTTDLSVIRVGGATDGTTAYSWKVVTGASTGTIFPFETLPLAEWYATLGSPVTATVEILTDNVTLTDNQIWLEVQYLGSASYPLASGVSDAMALLGTAANQATSSVTWNNAPGTPVKQKLEATFTPQLAGLVRLVVKVAKASTTVYVDPYVTLA